MPREKIIVGLSGGVDSSVAALILQDQGYHVEGLFMKNWDEKSPDGRCMWEADVEDAMQVCEILGISLNTVDLSLEYWDGVFTSFLEEYKNGRTPNPDILCNQEIKFKAFLNQAFELGADRIATGHYARIKQDGAYQLLKGKDAGKDQSYFLCRLNQDQLEKSIFPVGELEKPAVRKLAKKARLVTHDKKDSTGICFIGDRHFREFLGRYIPRQAGEIRTCDGKIIGEHDGVVFYTIGQRQGLGIGGIKDAGHAPWYVVNKDLERNILYVEQGRDHPLLFSDGLTAVNLHWISGQPPRIPLACMARTRYRQPDQACVIATITGDHCEVHFTEPQRAVTPGQYVVFYMGDICLGGAVIEKTVRSMQACR